MSKRKKEDPMQPHSHEPNPDPPTESPEFVLVAPNGRFWTVTPEDLQQFPETAVANCYIISTGHGKSGPFTFSGVQLIDLIRHYIDGQWAEAEIASDDGFGNRVLRAELEYPHKKGPILLATARDGQSLSRQQGAIRLIVPQEKKDALRQVKWVSYIRVV